MPVKYFILLRLAAIPLRSQSLGRCLTALWLDHDRCPVSQNFRDALHDLRGVIADANHGIGAKLPGMLQHQVQRFLARLFAQIGQHA